MEKNKAAANEKYLDTSLPEEERVADLVSRLTLEEKVSLMNDESEAIPRLGIKEYQYWNEALHGVARAGRFTVFPQAIAIASTWNPELVEQMTTAISDEAWGAINRDAAESGYPAGRFLNFWSPTINMARDPRWGRTPETYGEDPFLTSKIAIAFVRGMQGYDDKYIKAAATPKHFVANNEEHNRASCNAKISERTLREYYFPAFKAAIIQGNAQSIMGAYNAVNGIPCNANKWLLSDVLRGEWGFDGFVVTDCAAPSLMISAHKYAKDGAEAAAFSLNAGVDVECGNERILPKHLIEAVERGLITEERIDFATSNIIRARMRVGTFDPPEMNPYVKISPDVIGSEKHVALARRISQESIVLLENKSIGDGKLLPLNAKEIKSIVMLGPYACDLAYGDYSGEPANEPVTLYDGIKTKVGGDAEIHLIEWGAPKVDDFKIVPGDALRVADGSGANGLEARFYDNPSFDGGPVLIRVDKKLRYAKKDIPAPELLKRGPYSVTWSGKIIAPGTGLYVFDVDAKGTVRLEIDNVEILNFKTKKNKKGKLNSGTELQLDHFAKNVSKLNATVALMEKGREYDLKLSYIPSGKAPLVKLKWIPPNGGVSAGIGRKEIELIKNADSVVAAMGYLETDEIEGMDRDNLGLPNLQVQFVKQMLSLNSRMIVTLTNGSPLTLNWMKENAPAILEWWYPGEQGGAAMTDVLFGDYNPAGRMTVTVHESIDDLPPFDDYEISNGRTYMYFDKQVSYPFGYGLSYADFKYRNLSIDKSVVSRMDTITLSVDVENVGEYDGDEVVQVYARDIESSAIQPRKKLIGFKRVRFKKGESRTVRVPLVVEDLHYWDIETGGFIVEPGAFEIQVGASSSDVRVKGIINVQ